jgi:lysophospholipase L1-like esterase
LLGLAAACGSTPPTTPPPPPDAPGISCPSNVTISGVSGGGQQVTYTTPTVVGGAAPVTVACAPASGTSFAVGATAVTCSATDALSRRAQCAFSVTLTARTLSVTKFLTYGDSLTEGENGRFGGFGHQVLDTPNAYPTKLALLLNTEYPNQGINVVNRGISGEPVGDAARRLPSVLLADRPGAMLLLDGYNNLLGACRWPSASSPACSAEITEVVAKIRECIRTAKSPPHNVTYVFVSTLTPPGPASGPNDRRIAPDAIAQTNVRLAAMVPAEGAVLVDPYPLFVGHEAEYVDLDGLHLRPAGYQVLADKFFAAIKATVPATGLSPLDPLSASR